MRKHGKDPLAPFPDRITDGAAGDRSPTAPSHRRRRRFLFRAVVLEPDGESYRLRDHHAEPKLRHTVNAAPDSHNADGHLPVRHLAGHN
jgi:hypothetical protein